MTRAADNGLRPIVRRGLVAQGCCVTPLETGGVVAGVPDTFWAHRGRRASGWLELKAQPTGQRGVDLRPHQVGWLTRHAAAGVSCAVGVWITTPAEERLLLLAGAAAPALLDDWRAAADAGALLLELRGPPRIWDWGRVLETLCA
jgi:hypothetical protein